MPLCSFFSIPLWYNLIRLRFSHDRRNRRQVQWEIGVGKSVKKLLVFFIRGYQTILSPLFPPVCRFTPTCSHYAIEAIQQHGSLKGLLLAGYRILRCHPFCRGGYDPVKK